jgi:hypothetical protein
MDKELTTGQLTQLTAQFLSAHDGYMRLGESQGKSIHGMELDCEEQRCVQHPTLTLGDVVPDLLVVFGLMKMSNGQINTPIVIRNDKICFKVGQLSAVLTTHY